MVSELQDVAISLMRECLGTKEGNEVAIVCDVERINLADAVAFAADHLKAKATILTLTEKFRKTRTITEPTLSDKLLEALAKFDIVVLLLAQIGAETPFRREFIRLATEGTVRVANLPGITEKTFLESLRPPDRAIIEKMGNEISAILRRAKKVRVRSPAGTNIHFDLNSSKAPPEISSGFILQPSTWGNLPGAEVYIAPRAWSAKGKIVVDLTFPRGHLLKAPISFEVDRGRVDSHSIKSSDKMAIISLKEVLSVHNGDALAEFGVGLNKQIVKPTGTILIDEKMYGTCHFALGDNIPFGGEIRSRDHFDMVLKHPSVWIDGDLIIKRGEFVYDSKVLRNNYKLFPGRIPLDGFVTASSRVSCRRSNGQLVLFWRGGANQLHEYKLGDEETSALIANVWTALNHGGNYIQKLVDRTGLDAKTIAKVVELLVDHQVLMIAKVEKKGIETLEDMLKTKSYERVEPLQNSKSGG